MSDPIERAERLTDAEWREFQSIPDQGYSHRGWIDHRIQQRLDALAERVASAEGLLRRAITAHRDLHQVYGNTSACRGGVGGKAMTAHCGVICPSLAHDGERAAWDQVERDFFDRSHPAPAEVEYGALRKSDGWSTAMPGASLEWASAQVPTDSILTLVQRRPGIAPGPWVEITTTPPVAAAKAASGYTSHGHRIAGVVQTGRPTSVARCGGPGLCTVCSLEAGMATNERHAR